MNSASKLQKRLALPLLLIFVAALLFCALGTPAHAGDVAGVSTHLWLTVTGDYDNDATFYVSYTDALGPHTKEYYPGIEIAAWTPVTITVVDHTAEHWTLDVDVQETWLQGVGGVTTHGDVFRVTGTNSVQVFATNFGLHYVNVHVALSELDDAGNGGSGGSGDNGGSGSGGSGDNGGSGSGGSGDNGGSGSGGSGDNGGSGNGGSGDNGGSGGNGGSGDNGGSGGNGGSGDNGGSGGSGGGDGTDPDDPSGDTDSDNPDNDDNGGNVPGSGDHGDNGGNDNGGNSPKTGDTRVIGVLVALALLCVIVFVATYVKRRKHAK